MLASLTPREERIFACALGLGMNSDHTLEQVGKQLTVTRKRISEDRGRRRYGNLNIEPIWRSLAQKLPR